MAYIINLFRNIIILSLIISCGISNIFCESKININKPELIKKVEEIDKKIKEKAGENSGFSEQIDKAPEVEDFEIWGQFQAKKYKNFKNILTTKLQNLNAFKYYESEKDKDKAKNIIEQLLKMGAEPYILPATMNQPDLIKLILKYYNNDKAFNNLMKWQGNLSADMLDYLLEKNNVSSNAKSKALFKFIEDPARIQILLKYGANPATINTSGKTALQEAKIILNKYIAQEGLQDQILKMALKTKELEDAQQNGNKEVSHDFVLDQSKIAKAREVLGRFEEHNFDAAKMELGIRLEGDKLYLLDSTLRAPLILQKSKTLEVIKNSNTELDRLREKIGRVQEVIDMLSSNSKNILPK